MNRDYLAYTVSLVLLCMVNNWLYAGELDAPTATSTVAAKAAGNGTLDAPTATVNNAVHRLLSKLAAEHDSLKDNGRLYALVNDTVVPHLDMEKIARIVLGKHARDASPATFERFLQAFQAVLVRSYAASLKGHADETIEFPRKVKLSGNGTASVPMAIRFPGGRSILLNFRLHNKNGPWLIYDIRIEGISLVASYRSEYSIFVRDKGLDALIALLESKNQGARVASY